MQDSASIPTVLAGLADDPGWVANFGCSLRAATMATLMAALVNHAAVSPSHPTEEFTVSDWSVSLNVNSQMPFQLVEPFLPG